MKSSNALGSRFPSDRGDLENYSLRPEFTHASSDIRTRCHIPLCLFRFLAIRCYDMAAGYRGIIARRNITPGTENRSVPEAGARIYIPIKLCKRVNLSFANA